MRHTRIKRVVGRKGRVMYYLGDGLWFGRCSRARAEHLLATGEATLWDSYTLTDNGTKLRLEKGE